MLSEQGGSDVSETQAGAFSQLLPGKVFTRLGVDDCVGEIEA
jgi:hypothetical protein